MAHLTQRINKTLFIIALSTSSLTSCGGGSTSVPAPPPADTTPPAITNTIPASEEPNILPGSFISIFFNEQIKSVSTNQVLIHQLINGTYDLNAAIDLIGKFSYSPEEKKLTIQLKATDLKTNSQYRVTIEKIQDTFGNTMVGSCQWEFTTIDATIISTGNTGLCGTVPNLGPPGEPLDVIAIAGDNTVSLRWNAPLTGGKPTYYILDRSVDNSNFNTFNPPTVPATKRKIQDDTAQNGKTYAYRVIAGNNIDISKATVSNTVKPQLATLISLKPSLTLTSNTPVTGNQFGRAIAFSTTGTTLVIGEPNGEVVGSPIDSGTVQIFTKNTNWVMTKKLPSPNAGTGFKYGNAVALSSDNLNLAVGTPGMWSIYRYTNNPGSPWKSAGITSQGAGSSSTSTFGNSVAYSPNNTILAVGDYLNRSVTLLSNNGRLSSKTPATGNQFGSSVTFSPDGKTIAVAEPAGATVNGTGNVQLFTQPATSTTWTVTQILNSKTPVAGNQFGGSIETHAVAFSPDSLTLAVGEPLADPNGTSNAGSVQLFNFNGTTWVPGLTLTEQTPISNNQFGVSIAFSPNGNTIAIGASLGDVVTATDAGTVQLLSKSGSTWVYAQKLISANPASGSSFGYPIAYNSDGSLAVAEINGDAGTTINAGNVNIFNSNILP